MSRWPMAICRCWPMSIFASTRVSVSANEGDKVAIIASNGTGKSTLFRVLSGQVQPDDGEVWRQDTLRVSYLEQEVPDDRVATVYDIVAEGLGETGELLSRYHRVATSVGEDDAASLDDLHALQQKIEASNAWNTGRLPSRSLQ